MGFMRVLGWVDGVRKEERVSKGERGEVGGGLERWNINCVNVVEKL